jgi:hypothetical protein
MGAWAFMFAEIVSYSQSRVDSVTDLEKRFVYSTRVEEGMLMIDYRVWGMKLDRGYYHYYFSVIPKRRAQRYIPFHPRIKIEAYG